MLPTSAIMWIFDAMPRAADTFDDYAVHVMTVLVEVGFWDSPSNLRSTTRRRAVLFSADALEL